MDWPRRKGKESGQWGKDQILQIHSAEPCRRPNHSYAMDGFGNIFINAEQQSVEQFNDAVKKISDAMNGVRGESVDSAARVRYARDKLDRLLDDLERKHDV